jgi:hypothetical protein
MKQGIFGKSRFQFLRRRPVEKGDGFLLYQFIQRGVPADQLGSRPAGSLIRGASFAISPERVKRPRLPGTTGSSTSMAKEGQSFFLGGGQA